MTTRTPGEWMLLHETMLTLNPQTTKNPTKPGYCREEAPSSIMLLSAKPVYNSIRLERLPSGPTGGR